MRKMLAGLAAGAALFLASGLFAHHSGALYDREKPVTVSGTVTKFVMVNPHSQIHFDVVNEKAEVEKWVAETVGPGRLISLGWNRNTLKPGDKITVTGAQFKDGRKIMSVAKLTGDSVPGVLTEGAF